MACPACTRRVRPRQLGQALARQAGCPVHVTGDADPARYGAFLGAPGIAVIAGTGSVALGWDGERFAYAGGHGYLLGDEGSAYWIGRQAVRAALRWEEQVGGSELIYRTVTQATGPDLDVLIGEVNAHPADRGRLAVLAPAVTALAGHDPEAQRIVRRAAEHLAALAESIRRRLSPLPVAGVGGVFRAPSLWAHFTDLTGAARPLASVAVGAALLAATCHAGLTERFMLLSRSPGILERVTARLVPPRTRIARTLGVLTCLAAVSSGRRVRAARGCPRPPGR